MSTQQSTHTITYNILGKITRLKIPAYKGRNVNRNHATPTKPSSVLPSELSSTNSHSSSSSMSTRSKHQSKSISMSSLLCNVKQYNNRTIPKNDSILSGNVLNHTTQHKQLLGGVLDDFIGCLGSY